MAPGKRGAQFDDSKRDYYRKRNRRNPPAVATSAVAPSSSSTHTNPFSAPPSLSSSFVPAGGVPVAAPAAQPATVAPPSAPSSFDPMVLSIRSRAVPSAAHPSPAPTPTPAPVPRVPGRFVSMLIKGKTRKLFVPDRKNRPAVAPFPVPIFTKSAALVAGKERRQRFKPKPSRAEMKRRAKATNELIKQIGALSLERAEREGEGSGGEDEVEVEVFVGSGAKRVVRGGDEGGTYDDEEEEGGEGCRGYGTGDWEDDDDECGGGGGVAGGPFGGGGPPPSGGGVRDVVMV